MRRSFRGLRAALLVLAASAGASSLAAQDNPWQVGGGAGFEWYSFRHGQATGIDQLSLWTLPFAAKATVGRRMTLEASGSYARGRLAGVEGQEITLSSLVDSEVRATVPFGTSGMTAALTAVAILPTGQEAMSAEEAALAGAIASDLLPFRISNWGSGGGGALAASLARPFGASNLGISVGYRVATEFEPLRGRPFVYQPGDEWRVRVAADRSIGGSKASLQATVLRYGDGELEGVSLRSGDRIQLVGSYAFPLGYGASALVYVGGLHRTDGTRLAALGTGFDASLADNPSQTLFLAGSGGRLPLPRMLLLPSVDLRVFRSEDGLGQGYVVGVGTGAELPLGGSVRSAPAVLAPTLRLRVGNLTVSDGVETALLGVELGANVRFGGARP